MNKALVDRELLERASRIINWLECKDQLRDDDAEALPSVADGLRQAIAQPAEAEGAVQCPASHPAECYAAGTPVAHASLVHAIARRVDRYHAALSAVTTQRDDLLTEVERLRACIVADDVNFDRLAKEYKTLQAERDQLRAEVEGLRKERDRFRAEVKSLLDAIEAIAAKDTP
jgi:septal ring factor EnvC (AmiA/AmiB activator)